MNLFCKILLSITIIFMCHVTIDFVRFPEKYSTTMKYQLELDVKAGNKKAIEYYNDTYIKKGKTLFD